MAAAIFATFAAGRAVAANLVDAQDCLKATYVPGKAELIITAAEGEASRLRKVLAEADLDCVAQLQVDAACLVRVNPWKGETIESIAEQLRGNIFALKEGVAPLEKQAAIGNVIVNLGFNSAKDAVVPPVTAPEQSALPLDPLLPQQLELTALHAEQAWLDAPPSRVTTAIIDTGIMMDHEELDGQFDGGTSIGCHTQPCDGRPDPHDVEQHHGTRVAGIIAAKKNNPFGGAGVAWNTRFLSIYYGPRVTQYRMSCALQYAISQGADIVNASWTGGKDPGEYNDFPWDVFAKYVDLARAKGILIVLAAGNDGVDVDVETRYPLNLRLPNMLGVMEFDELEDEVPDSNYGRLTIDIAAPNFAKVTTCLESKHCYTETESPGSSWSTAYVSGAAALLKSHYPKENYDFLKWRIMANAIADARLACKNQSHGRLDLVHTIYPVTTRDGALSRTSDTRISWRKGIRPDMCKWVAIDGRARGNGAAGAYIPLIDSTPNNGKADIPHAKLASVAEDSFQIRVQCLDGTPGAMSLPLPLR
jgi:hypothetical protein